MFVAFTLKIIAHVFLYSPRSLELYRCPYRPKNSTEVDHGWECALESVYKCIPVWQLCDGEPQCEHEEDESLGCNLYPGMQNNF